MSIYLKGTFGLNVISKKNQFKFMKFEEIYEKIDIQNLLSGTGKISSIKAD